MKTDYPRKELDRIVKNIVSKVNPKWNKLQIIRFVYLELGKYLEKNTDYFLNDKLDKLSYSKTEMEDIYFNDQIYVSNRNKSANIQVICKSASIILQDVLALFDIDAYMVHTLGSNNGIYHWFLVAIADNNEQYFLSLTADLPFIKNNMPTAHFGNNLCYYSPEGRVNYALPNNTNLAFQPVSFDNGNHVLLKKGRLPNNKNGRRK